VRERKTDTERERKTDTERERERQIQREKDKDIVTSASLVSSNRFLPDPEALFYMTPHLRQVALP
jgi:hypothetical protein